MLWKLLGFQRRFDALFDEHWLGLSFLPSPSGDEELLLEVCAESA